MAKEIKDLVSNIFRQQDNWKLQLLGAWPSIFGALSDKVSLEKIDQDTLVLGVQDSCWLQELYLLSSVLIRTINQTLDAPRIKQLRFKTIGIKKAKKCSQQKKTEWPTQTITLNSKEVRALHHIKDEQLALFLKNFLIRCYREKV